jgi:hypothetical protein
MKIRYDFGFFFIVFIFSGMLKAQESINKEDFAFGQEIVVSENKSIIDVPLPENVYRTLRNSDLSDLAVFNAKNELVPHALIVKEIKTIDKVIPPMDLTIFPVFSSIKNENNFSHIKIETDKSGTITEIQNSKNNASGKSLTGYLIDAHLVKNPIEKFQVLIEENKENYLTTAQIEGSEDLISWNKIQTNSVLAKFEVNNEKLIKDEIILDDHRYNYYRLSLVDGASELKLISVKAFPKIEKEQVDEPLNWLTIKSDVSKEKQPHIYHYNLGGYYPISAIKFKFADQNSFAKISVLSSKNGIDQWTPILSKTFFTVLREGKTFSQLETNYPLIESHFLRIELESNPAGFGSRFPEVSIGWRPRLLRFLARGEGPFVLAYGSATIINHSHSDIMSSEWSNDIALATLKEKFNLGGEEKLVLVEKSQFPWKKILLACLLVLGVILLGSMVYQLKKQVPPL